VVVGRVSGSEYRRGFEGEAKSGLAEVGKDRARVGTGVWQTRERIAESTLRVNYFIGTVRMNCGKIAEIPTQDLFISYDSATRCPIVQGFGTAAKQLAELPLVDLANSRA
jgi:hypothetical protein